MLKLYIGIGLALLLGVLGGNGAVVVFNHMPARWLTDYGEPVKEDLLQRQRLVSTPWKYLFSGFLVIAGIRMAMYDVYLMVPVMCALWCMLILCAADMKYMILPDQFLILLAVCGFGFVKVHEQPIDMVYGALLGGGAMLLVALIGRFAAKQEALGFGDVKLMAVLGFMLGFKAAAIIIMGMSFLSCAVFLILLILKRIKKTDYQPLAPYICATAAIYLLVILPW